MREVLGLARELHDEVWVCGDALLGTELSMINDTIWRCGFVPNELVVDEKAQDEGMIEAGELQQRAALLVVAGQLEDWEVGGPPATVLAWMRHARSAGIGIFMVVWCRPRFPRARREAFIQHWQAEGAEIFSTEEADPWSVWEEQPVVQKSVRADRVLCCSTEQQALKGIFSSILWLLTRQEPAHTARERHLDSLLGQDLLSSSQRTNDLTDDLEASEIALHHPNARRIPLPPMPYVVHPYILTRRFFGRENELEMLDDWGRSSDSTLVIDGIGGVGKSALTWHWFCHYAAQSIPDLEGAMWWSFYESNATMDAFLRQALLYVSEPAEAASLPLLKYEERIERLFEILKKRRILFVFDGIERIMVAYHRLDASHLRDDQVEASAEVLRERQERSFTDPQHGDLLRVLCQQTQCKLLISTRLKPYDLEEKMSEGQSPMLDGIRYRYLDSLEPKDALALVASRGVSGNQDAMRDFMGLFDYHSLLLGVLAGIIVHDRQAKGDFDRWYALHRESLDFAALTSAQRRIMLLRLALESLPKTSRRLLCQVAAFRYPVRFDALLPLHRPVPDPPSEPGRPFEYWLNDLREQYANTDDDEERESLLEEIALEEEEIAEQHARWRIFLREKRRYSQRADVCDVRANFHVSLCLLERYGLLQWDRPANRYDLHPVVRGYAFEQLEGRERHKTFSHIRDHFERLPPEDMKTIEEVSELRRTIEIYHALIGAGNFDEAASFYSTQLNQVLFNQLGAYYTMIELLSPLFPRGLEKRPALRSLFAQGARIVDISNALNMVGRGDEAKRMRAMSIEIDLEQQSGAALGISLINYALSLEDEDRVEAASRCLRLALEVSRAAEDDRSVILSLLYLSSLAVEMGDEESFLRWEREFFACPSYVKTHDRLARLYLYRAHWMIDHGEDPEQSKLLSQAWEEAVACRSASIQCAVQRWRATWALQQGKLDVAERGFEESIRIARKSGSVNVAIYLGRLAQVRLRQGRTQEASMLIEEALSIRESFISLHLDAADVFYATGQEERGKRHLLRAYQEAWAEGPPYCWRTSLARCEDACQARGLPLPILAPFDPQSRVVLPHEERIEEFIRRLREDLG
ncbi:MAG: ATP-binding protein [Myxococcales bacterium]|nr:ATP-binding protein [Myxococcales bacterium]